MDNLNLINLLELGFPNDIAVDAIANESEFFRALKFVYSRRMPDECHHQPPPFPTLLRALVYQSNKHILLKRLARDFNQMSIYDVRCKIHEYKSRLETEGAEKRYQNDQILEMLQLILAKKNMFAMFYMLAGFFHIQTRTANKGPLFGMLGRSRFRKR